MTDHTPPHSSPVTADLLTRLRDFVAAESKRWINFGTGDLYSIEVSPAGKLVQEALEALARPAQCVPDGFALVPRIPTPEMIKVGTEARWQSAVRNPDNTYEIYRAMVSEFTSTQVPAQSRNEAIEQCARHVETTGLRNPDNIARDLRALAVTSTNSQPRTCATCHAVLADGPQPAATYAVTHPDGGGGTE